MIINICKPKQIHTGQLPLHIVTGDGLHILKAQINELIIVTKFTRRARVNYWNHRGFKLYEMSFLNPTLLILVIFSLTRAHKRNVPVISNNIDNAHMNLI